MLTLTRAMKNKIRHIAHDVLSNYTKLLRINKEEYDLQNSLNYIKCDRKIRAARDLNVDMVLGASFELCSVLIFFSCESVHESVRIKITPVNENDIRVIVIGCKSYVFYISSFDCDILDVCNAIKNDILVRISKKRMKAR
ncbi:hypothetical protein EA14781_037_00360 [Escherichia albertii NBRC 107761 = DSM 17582]|nr:hypothetical protein EA14781_037_00360 [Escherichia albertii NBRC 107761 = DSM 17582]